MPGDSFRRYTRRTRTSASDQNKLRAKVEALSRARPAQGGGLSSATRAGSPVLSASRGEPLWVQVLGPPVETGRYEEWREVGDDGFGAMAPPADGAEGGPAFPLFDVNAFPEAVVGSGSAASGVPAAEVGEVPVGTVVLAWPSDGDPPCLLFAWDTTAPDCPGATWTNYRTDCVGGVNLRYKQTVTLSLDGGCPGVTSSKWEFDSFQGCCACGPAAGSGSGCGAGPVAPCLWVWLSPPANEFSCCFPYGFFSLQDPGLSGEGIVLHGTWDAGLANVDGGTGAWRFDLPDAYACAAHWYFSCNDATGVWALDFQGLEGSHVDRSPVVVLPGPDPPFLAMYQPKRLLNGCFVPLVAVWDRCPAAGSGSGSGAGGLCDPDPATLSENLLMHVTAPGGCSCLNESDWTLTYDPASVTWRSEVAPGYCGATSMQFVMECVSDTWFLLWVIGGSVQDLAAQTSPGTLSFEITGGTYVSESCPSGVFTASVAT